jgi:Kdo2-lipid IVA lauroyltransferase/acyltransferase
MNRKQTIEAGGEPDWEAEGEPGDACLSSTRIEPPFPRRLVRWGNLLGELVYRLDRTHRTIVRHNLHFAYPTWSDRQITDVARRTFRNFGAALMETLQLAGMSRGELLACCRLHGGDHMQRALGTGGGIILVSAHLGNWEIALQYLACRFGRPIHLVVKPFSPDLLDRRVNRLRTRFGNRIINKKQAFPAMLKALRGGGIVALMLDVSRRKQSVAVDFFGQRVRSSHAAALLATRCDAPVLPAFSYRTCEGVLSIEVGPIISVQRSGDLRTDLKRNTQILTDAIETAVRKHPDQYLWMQRRWKDYHPHLYPGYSARFPLPAE